MKNAAKIQPFDISQNLKIAGKTSAPEKKAKLTVVGKEYAWGNEIEKINLVREGISYDSIEAISKRLNNPVKSMLALLGIPQTTYNKKKSEQSVLDSRDSELVIQISELLDYGLEVFNNEEEKFLRWLKKPNMSLGGNVPESLLDTISGINEVKFSLDRIEYGNFA